MCISVSVMADDVEGKARMHCTVQRKKPSGQWPTVLPSSSSLCAPLCPLWCTWPSQPPSTCTPTLMSWRRSPRNCAKRGERQTPCLTPCYPSLSHTGDDRTCLQQLTMLSVVLRSDIYFQAETRRKGRSGELSCCNCHVFRCGRFHRYLNSQWTNAACHLS